MQTDHALVAHDSVLVPFGRGFTAFFGRKAAHPRMTAKGLHRRAMDWENIPVGRVPLISAIDIVPIVQHLHFNRPEEGHTWRRNWARPDKDARVPTGAQMSPLQFENKVFILSRGAKRADRLPGAMNHSRLHTPSLGCTVDIDP